MSSNKKSTTRRLTAAALLATLLAAGGAFASGTGTASAGDGPPRCCYSIAR
jgi:hypothetical protein